ncbi:hypothetical protein SAMD00019534_089270 [Acytostelium subglobosum LB1]|uniref:hypothetical protein n=1 Tax=Acytostelium subglobosum LB1 TaxID=1410327 RepID=UPI000644B935|nr:hypothetical protein SAMD00019534_089270 [Acytostelium subglobosum LB1]GAM25752.1 hypothetical protein SAMD00019534_089270 [Acytostelium subglobosum LB1]|eukprot:XP_012751270.1 hypothetical protein SAMD00019534_089270 [Acytostelium subglobosum LB1]
MSSAKNTILISDAVGLVGAFIITELVSIIGKDATPENLEIRAGYHTETELANALANPPHPSYVKPCLTKWKDVASLETAMQGCTTLFLLTPFTCAVVAQRKVWVDLAIRLGVKHILHAGIHNGELPASDIPAHEEWNRQSEQYIESQSQHLTWTHLRINFDGYNGVVSIGKIQYFLPAALKCGWIAREDIAAVAARVLLAPADHAGKRYRLSTESLSLEDMAAIASEVVDKPIPAVSLKPEQFFSMATSALANPDNDDQYVEYMKSVQSMFQGLSEGLYIYHLEAYPEVVEQVCQRPFLSFRQWLTNSPHKAKLLQ